MVFVVSLQNTRKLHVSIRFIIDRMKKSAHLIRVKFNYKAENYAKIYSDEIVRWHGIPLSIISNRGFQFSSHFWISFQKIFGT